MPRSSLTGPGRQPGCSQARDRSASYRDSLEVSPRVSSSVAAADSRCRAPRTNEATLHGYHVEVWSPTRARSSTAFVGGEVQADVAGGVGHLAQPRLGEDAGDDPGLALERRLRLPRVTDARAPNHERQVVTPVRWLR